MQINTYDSLWRLCLNIPSPVYTKTDSLAMRGAGRLEYKPEHTSFPEEPGDVGD